MTVYFITRSYLPDITGGTLIRRAQVEGLRAKGYRVVVVKPGRKTNINLDDDIIEIKSDHRRIRSRLQRLEKYGFVYDYLILWSQRVVRVLKPIVKSEDIIFATSGGELGCIYTGVKLKKHNKCKLLINLHDPVDNTTVNDMQLDYDARDRDRLELRFFKQADKIITSSRANALFLRKKLNLDGIESSYFGYIKEIPQFNVLKVEDNQKTMIMYGGNAGPMQKPSILAEAAVGLRNVNINFYSKSNRELQDYAIKNEHIHLFEPLGYDEYVKKMQEDADIGFVSLTMDYLGVCMPSKIFEYINVGLPILAALPIGDAFDLINQRGYGIAVPYGDVGALKEAIIKMTHRGTRIKMKENVNRDKHLWNMKNHISDLDRIIKLAINED